MSIFTTLAKILVAPLIFMLGAAGYGLQAPTFGATANPGANALYEQSLAQPLGTTDSNMYVTSGADVQGNLLPLNSYQCLSVDTGQPNFEAICGTITASATSGLTLSISLRGLNTQTATTSNASYIFTHRRGADVRITDFPALTIVNNQLNGSQSIPNAIFYSSNFTPSFWSGAASNTLATIGIVNSTAAAGCGNANTSASGCVQLATAAQAAAGTSVGSTGANLVIPTSISTSSDDVAGFHSVVTQSTGKINWNQIDLGTSATFTATDTFTAGILSTASSTLTATTSIAASNVNGDALKLNGVPYAFPASQCAASTTLMNDGSGNELCATVSKILFSTTTTITMSGSGATTTMAEALISANSITPNTLLTWTSLFETTGGSNACQIQMDYGTGLATTSISYYLPTNTSGSFNEEDGTLFSTSTSAEAFSLKGFYLGAPTPSMITQSQTPETNVFETAYSLANPTYLDFRNKNSNGGVCYLMNFTVTLMSK